VYQAYLLQEQLQYYLQEEKLVKKLYEDVNLEVLEHIQSSVKFISHLTAKLLVQVDPQGFLRRTQFVFLQE
jgi:hypothetical protein